MKTLEDFLGKTKKVGDCLVWTGAINSDGYARCLFNRNPNGKVHREVFNMVYGYYPELVRHTCDNRACINPEHLLPGNHDLNMQDRRERNRIPNQVSMEEYGLVKDLRESGKTYFQIGDQLGIKSKRVEYILTRRKES